MATAGTRWNQIKSTQRHGTQDYGQASDGTGESGNVPMFDADGSLTDSGKAASIIGSGSGTSNTHSESLTDGNSNFIFANGDIVTVVGVPNQ